MKTKVSIGLMSHNASKQIHKTIESLCSQTYKDFTLIIVDDCSTDNTFEIAKQYESKDTRIKAYKNTENKGYCENSRISFSLAGEHADYFAWSSDHDVYHPRWLETMIGELERNHSVVLAYSYTRRISENDEIIEYPVLSFETIGQSLGKRILNLFFKGKGFGDMIYGVFRVEALKKIGIFKNAVLPDVLLIWEISLYGEIKQIPEELWFRRYVGLFNINRQRQRFFSSPPWYTYLPWIIVHPIMLFWNTVLSPKAGGLQMRFWGIMLTVLYFTGYFIRTTIFALLIKLGILDNILKYSKKYI